MKKCKMFLLLLIVLILSVSIVACAGGSSDKQSGGNSAGEDGDSIDETLGASNRKVQKFVSFLLDNAYSDAIEQYNRFIAGNTELENEAAKCIESYLQEIEEGVLNGEYDEDKADTMTTTVQRVYTSTNCDVKDYDELTQNIRDALASKVAYKSGIALLESNNYIDAIAEFAKVIPGDADYKDAIEKRVQAIDTYKEEQINRAKSLVNDGDYISAISVLREAANALPEDSALLAELNTCEKNYISGQIQAADEIFTDYTKYQEALSVIQSALQYYPDDQSLLEKRDYYNMYAPINLYDMDAIKGEAHTWDTDVDTYNNEHQKAFWAGYGSWGIWSDTDITFNLNKSYNTFRATIYGRSNKNDPQYMTAQIYADGKAIYENLSIPDNGTPPFDINLDVTGVTELRIVLDQNHGAIGAGIGMSDMYIQRTAK